MPPSTSAFPPVVHDHAHQGGTPSPSNPCREMPKHLSIGYGASCRAEGVASGTQPGMIQHRSRLRGQGSSPDAAVSTRLHPSPWYPSLKRSKTVGKVARKKNTRTHVVDPSLHVDTTGIEHARRPRGPADSHLLAPRPGMTVTRT